MQKLQYHAYFAAKFCRRHRTKRATFSDSGFTVAPRRRQMDLEAHALANSGFFVCCSGSVWRRQSQSVQRKILVLSRRPNAVVFPVRKRVQFLFLCCFYLIPTQIWISWSCSALIGYERYGTWDGNNNTFVFVCCRIAGCVCFVG